MYNKDDIARDYGNKDGVFELSDMDDFYLKKMGLTPSASSATDAKVMYYSGYHAARRKQCSCMPNTFESKCGQLQRIEHEAHGLNESTYGEPIRFYK